MANSAVIYSKKEHVGYITLNRPEKGNAIDLTMVQELAEICTRLNGDEDVYVVLLTGAGDTFCTGGDEKQLVSEGDEDQLPSQLSPAQAVAGIDRPTIAALNGDTLGMGLELALACDMRVASDKAVFGLSQIAEGYIPMDGGTQRLSRIVGKGKALEMVLTGETIDAQTAFEIGLVNKLVSRDKLATEAESMSKIIASKAPLALRYSKEAVNKGLDLTLEQGLRLEADLYFILHTTEDRTEGIKSFLAKSKPEYKGK